MVSEKKIRSLKDLLLCSHTCYINVSKDNMQLVKKKGSKEYRSESHTVKKSAIEGEKVSCIGSLFHTVIMFN